MAKQPYIPLYIGDWEQDVNGLSIEAEGAWLKIVFKCWRNDGSFTATHEMMARICKVSVERWQLILNEWRINNICGIREFDGLVCISSRRILRDMDISKVRKEAGATGGKASRNTRTKKLYDSPGFLYLVVDNDKVGEFKVGISKDPDKRLAGIRRAYKRANISIVFKWPVPDMGNYEDSILEYYKDVRDGEWIYMDVTADVLRNEISSLIQKQNNSKSKPKEVQITDNDNEYDNGIRKGVQGERFNADDFYQSAKAAFEEIQHDELLIERITMMVHGAGYRSVGKVDVIQTVKRFLVREGAKDDFVRTSKREIKNYLINWISKNSDKVKQNAA